MIELLQTEVTVNQVMLFVLFLIIGFLLFCKYSNIMEDK